MWNWSLHLKRFGITSRSCPTDLPIGPPTCLLRDNQHPVDLSSCVSPSLPAGARSGLDSEEPAPGRHTFGLGADTVVQEYQPVVHRLRLSASP